MPLFNIPSRLAVRLASLDAEFANILAEYMDSHPGPATCPTTPTDCESAVEPCLIRTARVAGLRASTLGSLAALCRRFPQVGTVSYQNLGGIYRSSQRSKIEAIKYLRTLCPTPLMSLMEAKNCIEYIVDTPVICAHFQGVEGAPSRSNEISPGEEV